MSDQSVTRDRIIEALFPGVIVVECVVPNEGSE